MAVFTYKYRIGLNDVNSKNKIKNKAILKVLENGGGMHSASVGYGLNDMEKTNIAKLKEPVEIQSKTEYSVSRRDIDINNHVHNLYYLDYAYEALPEEVYRAEECNNIEIMYKKQVKLGDEIVCNYTKEDNQNIVTIKSKDESMLHAIIKLY